MFSKDFHCRQVKTRACLAKGQELKRFRHIIRKVKIQPFYNIRLVNEKSADIVTFEQMVSLSQRVVAQMK